jgi:hypothetical protein
MFLKKNYKLIFDSCKLFGVHLSWDISKINFTVKLKRQCFLLFLLAYNLEIHKTFDSNKIELQDMKKIFFLKFYKNIFPKIPFTLEILFLYFMYVPITLTITSPYLIDNYAKRAFGYRLSDL